MSTAAGGAHCKPGNQISGYYNTFFKQTSSQAEMGNVGRFGITNAPAGTVLNIWNVKLELGNKATDWTAAPEETGDALAEIDSRLQNSIDSYADDIQQLTVEISKATGTLQGVVMKDDMAAYIRYGLSTDNNGILELGQTNSDYKARVSTENGFQVIYHGAEISSMAKNTVSAPVVKPGRIILMGNNTIKLSGDGGLMFN